MSLFVRIPNGPCRADNREEIDRLLSYPWGPCVSYDRRFPVFLLAVAVVPLFRGGFVFWCWFLVFALGSLVNFGRQPILLSLARLASQGNTVVVSKPRSLAITTRLISMESPTVRIKLSGLYMMTIIPGVGCLHRLDSMAVTHGGARLTLAVRTAGLTRLNNTKEKNRMPRMIRLANHPGKAG